MLVAHIVAAETALLRVFCQWGDAKVGFLGQAICCSSCPWRFVRQLRDRPIHTSPCSASSGVQSCAGQAQALYVGRGFSQSNEVDAGILPFLRPLLSIAAVVSIELIVRVATIYGWGCLPRSSQRRVVRTIVEIAIGQLETYEGR